jgi:hypothetical protein
MALFTALLATGLAIAAEPARDQSQKTKTADASADAVTIPRLLSYQGKLLDNIGNPVPDTTYSVLFSLYTVPSGGTAFWGETQVVRTNAGLFSVLLGSVTPIGTLPDAGALYLGMKVGTDPEMTPRLRIVSAAYAYLTERAANADLLKGKDTTGFVRTGQANSLTSSMIVDGTVAAADLNQMGASSGQVMKWTGSAWAPRNDSVGQGGGSGDNAWVRGTPDSVLYTVNRLGIARGGSGNMLHGNFRQSHVNFGVSCTTGASGQNYSNATVSGGLASTAGAAAATIGGGSFNRATGTFSAVLGGAGNQASGTGSAVIGGATNVASGEYSVCGGSYGDSAIGVYSGVFSGYRNKAGDQASDTGAVVAGGMSNLVAAAYGTVSGGYQNSASGNYAFIGGGLSNLVAAAYGTVSGGYRNSASGNYAFIGGGQRNLACSSWATVGGGHGDSARGQYSTVGGGVRNVASGTNSTVAGGSANDATGDAATVGGGWGNNASGENSVVGGGDWNDAIGRQSTVGGGYANRVKGVLATVAGGSDNEADSTFAAVVGGRENAARSYCATVGGGFRNEALGSYSLVAGGDENGSDTDYAVVGGGSWNFARGMAATVAGGLQNDARRRAAAVGGGAENVVLGNYSTIGGGYQNEIAATYGSIAGGDVCRVYGNYGFAAGNGSTVDSGHSNSAALNGTTTTASSQLRCGTLSKAGGTFTIDHPLDPQGTILNHYFVESPQMPNLYYGSVVLGADGRVAVNLPDYFSALNRNPMVQLTGVGTSDVYLAEDVVGNRFVVAGKPGTKVYWTAMGERKDVSAEAIRRMMPVEQPKTGKLAGRSLDDNFLSGCMEQLVREGKAQGIDFRTAAGRQRYEDMKRHSEGRE